MGQKVHPTGIRLGIIKDWTSTWFANSKKYADYLHTDLKVREHLRRRLANASVSRIQIERPAGNVHVVIHTARPGIVIGKKGEDIERLRREVFAMMRVSAAMKLHDIKVSVEEIRKPELDARLVAESVAQQIERRIMFRRAMKRAVTNTMRLGALGMRINVAGRLNGAEIARSEWYREGRVPLHTLRADIDYGLAEAATTYGVIGVKVWIFKGEVFGMEAREEAGAAARPGRRRPPPPKSPPAKRPAPKPAAPQQAMAKPAAAKQSAPTPAAATPAAAEKTAAASGAA